MIKRITILIDGNFNSLDHERLAWIVAPMINNGTIASMTIIDQDIIVIEGCFQRGVNQALLAIDSYIRIHMDVNSIVEYS